MVQTTAQRSDGSVDGACQKSFNEEKFFKKLEKQEIKGVSYFPGRGDSLIETTLLFCFNS